MTPTPSVDTSQPSSARSRMLGIGLIVATVAFFACIDSSAKWLNRHQPIPQTVVVRYVGGFLFSSLFLNPWSRPGIMRTSRGWIQFVRALSVMGASFFGFLALRALPLTVVTSVTFSSPLLVAVLAGPLLGEKLGPRRAVIIVVGFIGVLIITRPGSAGFHSAMVYAFITAGFNASYTLTARILAAYDKPQTTMFYTALIGSIAALPLIFLFWQTPSSLQIWAVSGVLSVCGAMGQWCLIVAHKHAPASVLAPFFYAQLIFAVILGALVFHEWPDRWTFIGGSVVMGSGLYLLYRERVRHKEPSIDVSA